MVIVNENDIDIAQVISMTATETMNSVQIVHTTGKKIDSDIVVFDNVDFNSDIIRDVAAALSNSGVKSVICVVGNYDVINNLHPAISSKFSNRINLYA